MPLFLNSASSVVPGFEEGSTFGSLVPTAELLSRMNNGRSDAVNNSFVAERLGVESVAFTNTTLNICERFWAEKQSGRQAFLESHGAMNGDLHAMLESVIQCCVGTTRGITYHFHIAAAMAPSGGFRVRDAMIASGLCPSTPSMIVPEGCSGLLSVLRYLDSLLGPTDNALVTGESDMSLFSHQRADQDLSKDNIDHWLWGALFGEGVGAMLIGREPTGDSAMQITALHSEVVEKDWRVCLERTADPETAVMTVKARAVKRTYLEHVSKHAREILSVAGGVENVGTLCLHESNARLVQRVCRELEVPSGKAISICHKVGSLAGVSIFTLVDRAIRNRNPGPIANAIIGEAGGVIRAGRFLLTPV